MQPGGDAKSHRAQLRNGGFPASPVGITPGPMDSMSGPQRHRLPVPTTMGTVLGWRVIGLLGISYSFGRVCGRLAASEGCFVGPAQAFN